MELNLQQQAAANIIRSVRIDEQSCRIKIGETTHTESVILTLEHIELWPVTNPNELVASHFEQLAKLPVEVVLLGSGPRISFPSAQATQPLIEAQIGIEVMDTAAACRTFNILAGDGRRVAAALILW